MANVIRLTPDSGGELNLPILGPARSACAREPAVSSTARGEADPVALTRAYETGQVTYGGMGLKSTPIIDYRGYVDAPENRNENHSRFHSFSIRARLEQANGSVANQIMLIESGPTSALWFLMLRSFNELEGVLSFRHHSTGLVVQKI